MSHHEERGRHRLPLPPEQRAKQPFVIDCSRTAPRLVCPWPRKKPQPGDLERLDAMLAALDLEALPAPVCWCWPDRKPEAISGQETFAGSSWLAAWARDRQVVKLVFGTRLAA